MGSKAGVYGMNRHKKTASKVTAKLADTSKVFQSMTPFHSRHGVNNNTASNAGTDPAMSAAEANRRELIKRLFPKKKHHCFECKTRITNTTRKRIMTLRRVPGHVTMVGHRVCKPCAVLLQAGKFGSLPVISRDIAEADFNMGLMRAAGGIH
jgi:hypothetical protein